MSILSMRHGEESVKLHLSLIRHAGALMRFLTLMGAAFASFFATPAAATIIVADNINYTPGAHYGDLHLGANPPYESEPAGRFFFEGHDQATLANFDVYTFCVDIFRAVGIGSYELLPLASLTGNVAKQGQLAALAVNAGTIIDSLPTLLGREQAAASFQLAIWEVIYEGGSSGYDISSGNFWASGANFAAISAQANGYLGNVTDGTWQTSPLNASILRGMNGQQSQIFANGGAAVPEPATWLMMILGFGFVGAALRRARARGQFAFA